VFFVPPWCKPVEVRSPPAIRAVKFCFPGKFDGGLSSPSPLRTMVAYVCLLFLFFSFV
jgi:hypothetical protein